MLQHLDFGLMAYRAVREYISVVSCHQNCGNLLQQPQETNTEAVTQRALHQSALNWCYMSATHPAPEEPCQTLTYFPLPGNICLPILNVLGNVQETIIVLQLNSLESMWLEKITSPRLKI